MIKALLFDIGNVLITFDKVRGYPHVQGKLFDNSLRLSRPDSITNVIYDAHSHLWGQLRLGRMAEDEFLSAYWESWDSLGFSCEGEADDVQRAIDDQFEPLVERIALLNKFKAAGDYKIALVSDTIPSHMRWMEKILPQIFAGVADAQRVYSYEVGSTKSTGIAMYGEALRSLGVEAHEAVMIDDLHINRPCAEALGLSFLRIDPHEDLQARLATEFGVIAPR